MKKVNGTQKLNRNEITKINGGFDIGLKEQIENGGVVYHVDPKIYLLS
jgi:hypothetical protein